MKWLLFVAHGAIFLASWWHITGGFVHISCLSKGVLFYLAHLYVLRTFMCVMPLWPLIPILYFFSGGNDGKGLLFCGCWIIIFIIWLLEHFGYGPYGSAMSRQKIPIGISELPVISMLLFSCVVHFLFHA